MRTVQILGARHAFAATPARATIASRPVWLAVGLSAEGMHGRARDTYPFMTSEHEHSRRCLVALQHESDLGRLVAAAIQPPGSDVSTVRSSEGEAHTTAALLKMPVLFISEVTDSHVTGWMDDDDWYV